MCCESQVHTLGLFNHNYLMEYTHFSILDLNTAICCSVITLYSGALMSKKLSFQFDLLLKLFDDDEKATNSNKPTSMIGRAGQTQRDNKKTVGLQVEDTHSMLWCVLNCCDAFHLI